MSRRLRQRRFRLQIEGGRNLYGVALRKAALIDRQTEAATGIDIKQRSAQGHVAESLDEGNLQRLAGQQEAHRVAERITEAGEVGAADVGDQVSEGAIGADDGGREAMRIARGFANLEANQLVYVEWRADLRGIVSAREVSADGAT